MSEADIPAFVKAVGSLPAEKIVLPSPLPVGEDLHFHNVKEVKSLLRKDGSFFIKTRITPLEEDAEASYQSLEAYRGPKSRCDNCSRDFANGEAISVDNGQGLVFCYSDAGGGCGPAYTFSSGKTIFANPMKFGSENLPPEQRIPNYPNSPVVTKEHETKPRSWLGRLLGL